MQQPIPVFIQLRDDSLSIPTYAKPGDSGFDLIALESAIVRPGETVKIQTGIGFQVPEGYEIQIRPRSGVSLRTKLRVVLGTIDSGYRGEVGIILDNIAHPQYRIQNVVRYPEIIVIEEKYVLNAENQPVKTPNWFPKGTYLIQKGDKIAQGVLVKVEQATFEKKAQLDPSERGIGGYGHTGV